MTTLEIWYLCQDSHTYLQRQYIYNMHIGYPSGNTISPYLDEMFTVLSFSSDPILNDFAPLFIKLSCLLSKWLSESCYVTSWMNVSQPHIISWCCVIYNNWGGRDNQGEESLIQQFFIICHGKPSSIII